MDDPKRQKPGAKAREISDKQRLTYIRVRLSELQVERGKLVEERRALLAKLKDTRGKSA